MNNQEIISKRWKKTDKILLQTQKKIRSLYSDIAIDIENVSNAYQMDFDELQNLAGSKLKRTVRKEIKKVKDAKAKKYIEYIMARKLTNATCLYLLILLIYFNSELFDVCKDAIVESSKDVVRQAEEESGETATKEVNWKNIKDFAFVPTANSSFEDYLLTEKTNEAQEAFQSVVESIQNQTDINVDVLTQKQAKRIVNINGDKESGVLVHVTRAAANKAYVEMFSDELVRFIAEEDERTTEMCKSLDGQTFHTKKENTFSRYSASDAKNVVVTCFGLVSGLNLPPVDNHFHWCRSVITYLTSDVEMAQSIIEDAKRDKNKANIQFKSVFEAKTVDEWLKIVQSEPNVRIEDYTMGADNEMYVNGINGVELRELNIKDAGKEKTEYDLAVDLSKKYKLDIYMQKPFNYPENMKAADYRINGVLYELKSIYGNGKNTIDNAFKGSQANFYIIDMRNTEMSVDEAIIKVNESMSSIHRQYVKSVLILNKDLEFVELITRQ